MNPSLKVVKGDVKKQQLDKQEKDGVVTTCISDAAQSQMMHSAEAYPKCRDLAYGGMHSTRLGYVLLVLLTAPCTLGNCMYTV